MQQHIVDEALVHRTMAQYCRFVDQGRFSELAALFTDDAAFVVDGEATVGRAAIGAWFDERHTADKRGKHLAINTVTDIAGDEAIAETDFLFLRFVDGVLAPAFTGTYRDRLRKVDGRWLIARREIDKLLPPT